MPIYTCELCEYSCKYRQNYTKHLKTKSCQRNHGITVIDEPSDKDKYEYICDTCGISYSLLGTLINHQKKKGHSSANGGKRKKNVKLNPLSREILYDYLQPFIGLKFESNHFTDINFICEKAKDALYFKFKYFKRIYSLYKKQCLVIEKKIIDNIINQRPSHRGYLFGRPDIKEEHLDRRNPLFSPKPIKLRNRKGVMVDFYVDEPDRDYYMNYGHFSKTDSGGCKYVNNPFIFDKLIFDITSFIKQCEEEGPHSNFEIQPPSYPYYCKKNALDASNSVIRVMSSMGVKVKQNSISLGDKRYGFYKGMYFDFLRALINIDDRVGNVIDCIFGTIAHSTDIDVSLIDNMAYYHMVRHKIERRGSYFDSFPQYNYDVSDAYFEKVLKYQPRLKILDGIKGDMIDNVIHVQKPEKIQLGEQDLIYVVSNQLWFHKDQYKREIDDKIEKDEIKKFEKQIKGKKDEQKKVNARIKEIGQLICLTSEQRSEREQLRKSKDKLENEILSMNKSKCRLRDEIKKKIQDHPLNDIGELGTKYFMGVKMTNADTSYLLQYTKPSIDLYSSKYGKL